MKALSFLFLLPLAACAAREVHETSVTESASARSEPVPAAAPADEASPFDKPGYVTDVVDGRLWIFRADSAELAEYRALGEPAKHVIKPGAGPDRMTVKAPDLETIQAYMAAAEGFETFVVDGRIWVFAEGDPALEEFRSAGEPAKHVIRVGVGPNRMTVKAPDGETIDAYLKAVGS